VRHGHAAGPREAHRGGLIARSLVEELVVGVEPDRRLGRFVEGALSIEGSTTIASLDPVDVSR
jgi:hypothetical protein